MPYVAKIRRAGLDRGSVPEDPGELNYKITKLVLDYTNHHGLRYRTINDVLGALEGAKLEYYRRVASDYEDEKIAQNGDVYS